MPRVAMSMGIFSFAPAHRALYHKAVLPRPGAHAPRS